MLCTSRKLCHQGAPTLPLTEVHPRLPAPHRWYLCRALPGNADAWMAKPGEEDATAPAVHAAFAQSPCLPRHQNVFSRKTWD